MIDFKKTKSLLLNALSYYGYDENKLKSTRNHRVFSNDTNKLIVSPNKEGVYDYYYNVYNQSDFGDTIKLVMYHEFKINESKQLSASQYKQLENVITTISTSTPMTIEVRPTIPLNNFDFNKLPTFQVGTKIYFDKFHNPHNLPDNVRFLFFKRKLLPDLVLNETFKDSFCLLENVKNDYVITNLLFLWRDNNKVIKGAQYKYYKDNFCYKHFLSESHRGESLWFSSLENKKYLFVCEDPIDALSHYVIYQREDYAYACTGGSITKTQITQLYQLVEQGNFSLVLGNDNDIAGQIANLKIIDKQHQFLVTHDKTSDRVSVISLSGVTKELNDLAQVISFITEQAEVNNIKIIIPILKDWNDDLKSK